MRKKLESANKVDESLKKEQGLRAKAAIIRTGMQQGDFAIDVLHVTPQHFSSIVTGKYNLTEDNAKIISNATGVRLEWLLCQDDYMTEDEIKRANEQAEYDALNFASKVSALDAAFEKASFQKLQFEAQHENIALSDEKISFFKKEVRHYADYLIKQLIDEENQRSYEKEALNCSGRLENQSIEEVSKNGSDCETEE